MFKIKGKYTTAKVMVDQLEQSCISQITEFVNHEAFTNPVVIQPDAHAGKSACVGFQHDLNSMTTDFMGKMDFMGKAINRLKSLAF